MSNVAQEILAANQRYSADFGDKARLAMPPARHSAIITCMDARLDPAKFAGLAEGDAHVIGNAGAPARMPLVHATAFRGEFLPGCLGCLGISSG
jgi:carbonic anhydrase